MTPTPITPTIWATLMYSPTEPSSKNGYTPEHSVQVAIAPDAAYHPGEQIRIYYRPGPLSQLRAGDVVLLEWNGRKWKPAKQQPPAVMSQLQGRAAFAEGMAKPNAAQAPPTTPPTAPPTAPPAATTQSNQPIADSIRRDARRFKFCYECALAEFPEFPPEELRAIATTLFIQSFR